MNIRSDEEVVFLQSKVEGSTNQSKAMFATAFGEFVAKLLHRFEQAPSDNDVQKDSADQSRYARTPK